MPIEKLRVLSLLVLAAVTSSLVTGEFSASQFWIYVAVIAPLWFPINLDRIRRNPIWKIFIYLTFLVFLASQIMGGYFKTSLFLLILFCIAYELYGEVREKAPLRLLCLLSFLFMVSQIRQNYGLSLMASLCIYLFAVIMVLSCFHLGGLPRRNYVLTLVQRVPATLGHALLIFALGLVVYWFIPRLPGQSVSMLSSFGGLRMSGFSDRVSLNDIGSIKLSRKHIMDITPLDGALHSTYLKGKILDQYHGGIWSTSSFYFAYRDPKDEKVFPFSRPPAGTPLFNYRIDVEPLQGNVIFFFNNLISLEGKLRPLKVNGSGFQFDQISVNRAFPTAMSYQVKCAPEGPIAGADYIFDPYLKMPGKHEYFFELAARILDARIDLDEAKKVALFNDYFLKNFKYSLDINNHRATDPLRDFLFNRKQGHCELFASSMVFLLRSQGIPSRLITGFLVPEQHPTGAFYSITEGDAHAWVEAFYQGSWHTIDPTPPTTFIPPGFMETQLNYLNWLWRSKIILWDFEEQQGILRSAASSLSFFFGSLARTPWLFLLLLIYPAFLLARSNAAQRLTRRWTKLDLYLQRRFRARAGGEAQADFFGRLPLPAGLLAELNSFLRDYSLWRFGRPTASPPPLASLTRRLRELDARIRRASRH